MSFGFSAGDFIAGANLAYQLIRALSDSKGATIEYQEAIQELDCMHKTFMQVGQMRASNLLSQATLNAISWMAHSSKEVIAKFLEKTEKYRQSLSRKGGTSSLLKDSWRKIGWSLYKKQELVELKMSLRTRLAAISVLVSTAHHQNKYEASRTTTKPQKSDSESAEADTEVQIDSRSTRTTTEKTIGPLNVSKAGNFNVKDIQDSEKDNANVIDSAASEQIKGKAGVNKGVGVTQEEEDRLKAAEKHALDTMMRFKMLQLDMKDKEGVPADQDEEKWKKEKPVYFKDAVGRSYKFPYHMCRTWPGMAELIKQAFVHVKDLGPQVERGRYDLVDLNGSILHPQFWEDLVEPGLSVTMTMWPTQDQPEKRELDATRDDTPQDALEDMTDGVCNGTPEKAIAHREPLASGERTGDIETEDQEPSRVGTQVTPKAASMGTPRVSLKKPSRKPIVQSQKLPLKPYPKRPLGQPHRLALHQMQPKRIRNTTPATPCQRALSKYKVQNWHSLR
ncbi:hypothetical protein FQN54_002018 [Arachnomyces sp. PD_36]|nr:hypothetical protein FQN54_002018 [Arachnomyces sp. PD_36]